MKQQNSININSCTQRTEDRQHFKKYVKDIESWFTTNRLLINEDETVELHCTMDKITFIRGKSIATTDSCNGLNVLESSSFSYEEHAKRSAFKAIKLAGNEDEIVLFVRANFLATAFRTYTRPTP